MLTMSNYNSHTLGNWRVYKLNCVFHDDYKLGDKVYSYKHLYCYLIVSIYSHKIVDTYCYIIIGIVCHIIEGTQCYIIVGISVI